MNIPACVAAVERCADRKSRLAEINKILGPRVDVGTLSDKKRDRQAYDRLHQRALFVTELVNHDLWPA